MGCCGPKVPADSEEYYGEALKFDKNFKGPLTKRSCTDPSCLFILVAFLACWGAIAQYAIKNGDLDQLLVPTDSQGRKCGIDNEVLHKPYLVFFNLEKCIDPATPITGCPTPQVCVEQCPTEAFIYHHENCNSANFLDQRSKLICKMEVDKSAIQSCAHIKTLIDEERCARWYLPSQSFSMRCIPFAFNETLVQGIINLQELIQAVDNLKILATINGMGQMIVEDVIESWQGMLIGLVIAMVCCLLLIAMMRWLAKPLVWISIIGIIAVLGFFTYYSTARYLELRKQQSQETIIATNLSKLAESWLGKTSTWLALSIISGVVLLIIFLVVLILRKRIVVAIALVKEGSKAVSSIISTVFFPIFPWILQLGTICFAVTVGLYLASVGVPVNHVVNLSTDTSCACVGPAASYTDGSLCDPRVFNDNCHSRTTNSFLFSAIRQEANSESCSSAGCHFKEINSPRIVWFFQAMNIVGFVWGISYFSALGQMVLAATFATWYWTFHKSDVPYFTLSVGLKRTIRYHLGTIAFGSFIITICRLIRICLEYIDQKLKRYDNDVTKCILCCLKCFFWCLETFLRFLNKNAYIMCAIHGKPFCTSARDAFNLLMRNALRVVALDKVTEFLFFLTKVLVTIGMGAITYSYFISDRSHYNLHYVAVPVTIVMVGTYLIASVFFSVYSTCVDTLFLCFLEDSERNDGSAEKPYFMSKQLMKILGKKNVIPRNQYQ